MDYAVLPALGLIFLSLIPLRRWLARREFRITATQLLLLGPPLGVLTGVVASTGPLTVPLFTFYGLERGAFLGTEAASSIGIYLAKVATFQAFGALTPEVLRLSAGAYRTHHRWPDGLLGGVAVVGGRALRLWKR